MSDPVFDEIAREEGRGYTGRRTTSLIKLPRYRVPPTRAGGVPSQPSTKRAVIKMNYVVRGRGSARRIKASARYYQTRETEAGERVERPAFAEDAEVLSRQEVNRRLSEADQTHRLHYRVVLSPGTDQNAEGGDLEGWTRGVMRDLRTRQGASSWLAVVHARETAHTPYAHVHVLTSVDAKISKETLRAWREAADQTWAHEQRFQRSLDANGWSEADMRRTREHFVRLQRGLER